jgi:hypothetical protein
MCSPTAIMAVTSTGINILSTVGEANAKNTEARQARLAATSDLMNKYNTTQLREQQEMQRTQLEVFQARQQGVSNASRIRAQAAGGGVAGASIQEREAQPGIAATNFASTAQINLANELRQNQLDAESFKSRAQSIINENQPVNPAAEGLQIAGEIAGGIGRSGFVQSGSVPQGGQGLLTAQEEEDLAKANTAASNLPIQ